MPWKTTVEHAKEDLREGKAPTTAAGEFVKEEMEHIRRGKHGAANTKQAIAIGLSKARRAGIKLKPPTRSKTSESTRRKAERDYEAGEGKRNPRSSAKGSRGREEVLKREPRSAASPKNLSRQAKQAAAKRGQSSRRQAAAKAVRTKGQTPRKAAQLRSTQRKAA